MAPQSATLERPLPAQKQSKKLFYRINEVSKMTGLKPYVLRYWETEFPELSPEKDASDQRRYREKDIATIQAIRKLLYEDRFTIKGARKQLKNELKQNGSARASRNGAARTRSATATKTQPAQVISMPREQIGRTLKTLRSEVHELLNLLDSGSRT